MDCIHLCIHLLKEAEFQLTLLGTASENNRIIVSAVIWHALDIRSCHYLGTHSTIKED